MFVKLKNRWKEFRLSLRMKMILSILAITVVLLMSIVISVLEYRRMSNYVSDMIAEDIHDIHATQRLVDAVDQYNLELLAVIGDDKISALPDFDRDAFMAYCDSLRLTVTGTTAPLADSVLYAYSAYMLASMELPAVLESDFINTRDWYFTRLQPLFGRMRAYLDRLSETIHSDLRRNSETFGSGYYRSFIPSAVALAVGIVLLFLLMFFILTYYVDPLYKMLESLRDYLGYRRRYTYTFDGNDQLSDLNNSITELTEENRALRKRISEIKEKGES
ncbi:MAG: hypothetical protein IJ753_06315 [Bacteroidales bacterium]|nr:hypothetical protein [Bacteroidales bacterium]MBR1783110.1 hypothetical protein [Bacteroidales bacterium]